MAKKSPKKAAQKNGGISVPRFNKTGFFSISTNKTFEWQLARWSHWNFFRHHLKWTRRRDHAGIEWETEILGLTLTLNLYDNRHWDDKRDWWEAD